VISRLVYFYVSNGSTIPGTIKWSPEQKTHDPFAHHFTQEGFCYLFQKLIDKKIIKDVLVVIESSRHSGSKYLSSNMSILAVPHIDELKPYLREDDIILARGGWRSWFPFLQEWHDLGRWLLFYRAASNRGAWKFWDIVLNDLQTGFAQDKVGRFYYPINKPVDPNLFYPMDEPKIYDLCIGASHIHEKKGQWKIVAVLDSYKKDTAKNFNVSSLEHSVNFVVTKFFPITPTFLCPACLVKMNYEKFTTKAGCLSTAAAPARMIAAPSRRCPVERRLC
jgi:hypothetical protein